MNYDGNNSFLYVNVTKIYQFKAKNQQNKTKPVVPRKYFTINPKKIAVIKMKKKAGLNGYVYNFLLTIILLILVILSIFIII